MVSKILGRSGIAFALLADRLDWEPNAIYQVGIGCNHYEVEILHCEWPKALWYGLEPNPDIFKGIADKYPGALLPYAAGDAPGRALLVARQRHKDGSSLFLDPAKINTPLTYDVEVKTLDSVWRFPLPRSLLWLDCEGSELRALQGATQLLDCIDVINIELTGLPADATPDWPTPLTIHRWLVERGFFMMHIHTQRLTAGQNDYCYVRPHLFQPEYCCVPMEVERFFNEQ